MQNKCGDVRRMHLIGKRETLVLVLAALLAGMLTLPVHAANVGYYDMAGQGNANQVNPINLAGQTPILLNDLSASDLATIDVLFVQNASNSGYGGEYVSRLSEIEAAVASGMVLIIHDRYVTSAAGILPGGGGIAFTRELSDLANDLDILDNTMLVTNGPGGVLDDTSLDGGSASSHGFASVGSLPAGAVPIISRADPSEIVTSCYRFSAGAVIYSTIPLDHYLSGQGPNPPRDNIALVYAPNVVAYGAAGACAAGLSVTPAGGLNSSGFTGGPFQPSSQSYTLTNLLDVLIEFSVSRTQDWVSLDDGAGPFDGPLTGMLVSGESRSITVSLDADADALAPGNYSDTVSFTNLTTGDGSTTRTVTLNVLDPTALGVLLLDDNGGPGTDALEAALVADGNLVTRRPPPEYTWDGSNPPLNEFNCVVHLNGATFDDPLPPSAQLALENFVNIGQGGFVGAQWNGFELDRGQQIDMPNLVLQGWDPGGSGCTDCSINYTAVAGQETHPVLDGIPTTFTFSADGHNAGALVNFGNQPSVVLMTIPGGRPGVIAREFGEGRVVNFSHAPNYLGDQTLQDPIIQQLYQNAVAWACGGGLSVNPPGGTISLGLEGGPFVPVSQTYTLINRGDLPIDYSVSKSQDWISLDDGSGPGEGPVTGMLAPGESTAVTVVVDETANALPVGNFVDTIGFVNLTSGVGGTSRRMDLSVLDRDMPQLIFNGDFELGTFAGWDISSGWQISDGTLDPPGPDGPLPTCQGGFSAVSTQSNAGNTLELIRDLDLLPGFDIVTLNWTDQIRNHAVNFLDPAQEFRVEIRDSNNQLLREVFSTNPGDPAFTDCTARTFDLSEFAEQTIRLAFIVRDSNGFFNVHVDQVELVLETSNVPPTAVVSDQTVECTNPAGANVILDGSGSSDTDSTPGTNDDIVQFEWIEDFGMPTETLLGTGEILNSSLALGIHAITLRVTDSRGAFDTDEAAIVVSDTTAPMISASLAPVVMWPPNHRMMEIEATVVASDTCGTPSVVLAAVTSNEPDNGVGDGNTVNDIQGVDLGTADFEFRLRAERAGGGEGRVYTIVYDALDAAGNPASNASFVFVPHDQYGVTEPIVAVLGAKPAGTVLEWDDVVGALYYNVVRGSLSAIGELANSIDLGTVTCIEAQSLDAATVGAEDTAIPGPGEAYFYVVEFFDGWHSSYGTASASKPRIPTSGGCD